MHLKVGNVIELSIACAAHELTLALVLVHLFVHSQQVLFEAEKKRSRYGLINIHIRTDSSGLYKPFVADFAIELVQFAILLMCTNR